LIGPSIPQEVAAPTIRDVRYRLRSGAGPALVALLSILLASPEAAGASGLLGSGAGGGSKLSMGELESLVAPVALYPGPILAQLLVASTYPLDIMEAQQRVGKSSSLKGDDLTEAAEKHDPSIQASPRRTRSRASRRSS